jgi:hypothetical protein
MSPNYWSKGAVTDRNGGACCSVSLTITCSTIPSHMTCIPAGTSDQHSDCLTHYYEIINIMAFQHLRSPSFSIDTGFFDSLMTLPYFLHAPGTYLPIPRSPLSNDFKISETASYNGTQAAVNSLLLPLSLPHHHSTLSQTIPTPMRRRRFTTSCTSSPQGSPPSRLPTTPCSKRSTG